MGEVVEGILAFVVPIAMLLVIRAMFPRAWRDLMAAMRRMYVEATLRAVTGRQRADRAKIARLERELIPLAPPAGVPDTAGMDPSAFDRVKMLPDFSITLDIGRPEARDG